MKPEAMNVVKDGGAAFPQVSEWKADSSGAACNTGYKVTASTNGMSLRDYFAAKAMQVIYTADIEWNTAAKINPHEPHRQIAFWSYQLADAMLAERERKP